VKRVESGFGPPVSDHARQKLGRALQQAGVEVIDENGGNPGVRLRKLLKQKQLSDGFKRLSDQRLQRCLCFFVLF
jgi:hypothetical protein